MMAFFKKITGANDKIDTDGDSDKTHAGEDSMAIDENEILVLEDVTQSITSLTSGIRSISSEDQSTEDEAEDNSPSNSEDGPTSLGDFNALRESLASFTPPSFTTDIEENAANIDITPDEVTPEEVVTVGEDNTFVKHDAPEMDEAFKIDEIREPVITRRTNLSDLRLDVTRISTDIDNGEALYRRAQQRVESLMHFIESAEVDFSLLNRLEPENRRLKAQTRSMTSEMDNLNHRVAVSNADLEDHQRRLLESKNQLDATTARMAKIASALQDSEKDLKRTTLDLDAMTLKYERQKTTMELEATENANLREKVTALSGALDDANNEKMIFAKKVESLKIDCDDQRNIKETLQSEIYELRNALEMSRKQNAEMRGQLQSVQEDIKSFKTQYEFNLISRDDRIAVLDSDVESLTNQLKIKDEIATEAVRDVNELRKSQTTTQLERQRLEKTNANLVAQLEELQSDLLFTRQEANRYEQRFNEAASALETAQQRETETKAALEMAHQRELMEAHAAAEEKARNEARAKARARAEAEGKAKQAKARAEADARAREAKARAEAEEQARRQAKAKAQAEADEKARKARALAETEEKAKAEVARERARLAEAEEKAREEKARADAAKAKAKTADQSERIMPKLTVASSIAPTPAPQVEDRPRLRTVQAVDDIDEDEITEDEINEMITEFKLGIRSKIG